MSGEPVHTERGCLLTYKDHYYSFNDSVDFNRLKLLGWINSQSRQNQCIYYIKWKSKSVSCSAMSNSLWPHGL